MANQTQIPVIQSSDTTVTQLQQNANKVLRNIYNQLTQFSVSLQELTIVGEIKIANLTESQFASIVGPDWFLCDGRSCVGTAYEKLTGNKVVPTLTLGSVNNFIKVN